MDKRFTSGSLECGEDSAFDGKSEVRSVAGATDRHLSVSLRRHEVNANSRETRRRMVVRDDVRLIWPRNTDGSFRLRRNIGVDCQTARIKNAQSVWGTRDDV